MHVDEDCRLSLFQQAANQAAALVRIFGVSIHGILAVNSNLAAAAEMIVNKQLPRSPKYSIIIRKTPVLQLCCLAVAAQKTRAGIAVWDAVF